MMYRLADFLLALLWLSIGAMVIGSIFLPGAC